MFSHDLTRASAGPYRARRLLAAGPRARRSFEPSIASLVNPGAMAACFEFAWIAASWAWGDELPALSQWNPLTDMQSNRILQGIGFVWIRFGIRSQQFVLHDMNGDLRMFRKIGSGPIVRILVRSVGPSLLLSVHAEHRPANGTVRLSYLQSLCVCAAF